MLMLVLLHMISTNIFESHDKNVKLLVIHSVNIPEKLRKHGFFDKFINDVHSNYDIIIAENSVSGIWLHYGYDVYMYTTLENYRPLGDAVDLRSILPTGSRIKFIV